MAVTTLSPLVRIALGGLAGLLATAPMSLCMLAGKRGFSRLHRRSLPPTQITRNMLSAVGLNPPCSPANLATLTALNHFGYGAGVGAIYGLSADSSAPNTSHTLGQGVGFGLGVWTMSYLGWLPITGLYRPATREPLERNVVMIAAHVVWGGALGLLFRELSRNAARRLAAKKIPPRESVNIVGL